MIDVSIVIPVYNEAENIIETLTNIENKLLFAHEILIVYDMDNDNTLPKAFRRRKGVKSGC